MSCWRVPARSRHLQEDAGHHDAATTVA